MGHKQKLFTLSQQANESTPQQAAKRAAKSAAVLPGFKSEGEDKFIKGGRVNPVDTSGI